MQRTTAKAARRRPLATIALIITGLMLTGFGFSLVSQLTAHAEDTSVQQLTGNASDGKKLFQANCSTCHGLNMQGTKTAPSLVGVGAAAVSFQVGTGRMPMAMSGPQAHKKKPQFTSQQIADMAAYVAESAPGPAIPEAKYTDGKNGDVAKGGELFRTNCAMCHNVAGAGGALTQGKFAPSLHGVSGEHIYEAMLTGPQNMPVFNDANLTPQDKADVISYLKYLEANPSPGGMDLGSLGPVSEGLFIWIFGLGTIIAFTVWLGARSN